MLIFHNLTFVLWGTELSGFLPFLDGTTAAIVSMHVREIYIKGWMTGVLQPFQHHRSYQARLPMKGMSEMDETSL